MRWVCTLLFFLFINNCIAQYYKIRGVIKDSAGQPVPWVTIKEDKSYNGTTSNADGNFYIIVGKGKTIRSTRLGYGDFEYTVQSDAMLHVELPIVSFVYTYNGMYQPEGQHGRVIFEIQSQDFIIPAQRIVNVMAGDDRIEDENRIFEKVEIPPGFNGGFPALCRSLARDVKAGKKGRLRLKFFIYKDGYVGDVQVLVSYQKKFDNRLITDLKKRIKMNPAMQNGRYVGVWCIMDLDVTKKKGKTILAMHAM
jgi:hypothetical protein